MSDTAKFGISRLDELLGGGLDRYTENLIIGRSGIGKRFSPHTGQQKGREMVRRLSIFQPP